MGSYVKHNWVVGEVITEALMDHLEEQYDEAAADDATHTALTQNIHGVGASDVANVGDIATHAALTATHGVAGTIADTAELTTHAALITGVHGAGSGKLAVVSSGSYSGNNGVNRAIPHGLGATPAIVFLMRENGDVINRIFGAVAAIVYWTTTAQGDETVTISNATNFYVGNSSNYALSANASGVAYYWVAFRAAT